jgi:hypothetical protein
MRVARIKSAAETNDNPPEFKGYSFTLDWEVGDITGAYIKSLNIAHFLSFNGNKATLITINFDNGNLSFRRPLPAIISSLENTVFTSFEKFYSLGR